MEAKKKRKRYKKKRYVLPIVVLMVLLAFRLYLPTLVKNYMNKVLADIPGYYGHVEDVDLSLYRGAYQLKGLYLDKVTAKTKVPFLNFPKTDISVEWKSLLHGKVVSEITMTSPQVIYVFEDQKTKPAEGEANTDDWTKALTDIVPLEINRFQVYDGKLAFVQLQANPNIDLHIDKLNLTASNLRNVKGKAHTLPSPIRATGVSIGKGKVKLQGKINLIKEIPDMDLSFSLADAQATALNDFTKHYAGLDFAKGTFSVYSEMAIADGYLKGYVKPLLKGTKLIGKDDSFLDVLWEGFVGMFKFILKNQGTNTLATRVPFEGDLNNVQTSVWSTVGNIFKNAWIKAFQGNVDNDIDYKDAFKDGKKDDAKDKKEKKEKKEKEKEKK